MAKELYYLTITKNREGFKIKTPDSWRKCQSVKEILDTMKSMSRDYEFSDSQKYVFLTQEEQNDIEFYRRFLKQGPNMEIFLVED